MALDDDVSLMAEVFSKIPSAVLIIDEKGFIKKANDSALDMLGEGVLENRRWVEIISSVFRPRQDDGHEISTRDGRRLQVSTIPLKQGQLIQMTDLTETRLLQDKISHMERLSSLGRMAASLAHQIRTPLSAAMLYAANLGNANLQPMARKRFQEKLMSRLEALEAQVSDILMFARSNEQTVSEIKATELLEQTANNVSAVLNKGNANLDTRCTSDEDLPILGNTSALVGALSNLIANAVEAGASNIILQLSKVNDRVVFSVANNGPKIPESLKTKIFEPFFTSKSSGTGLGLAVVTAVTKIHQGILSLESWDDVYATVFTISIPLFNGNEEANTLNAALLNPNTVNPAPNPANPSPLTKAKAALLSERASVNVSSSSSSQSVVTTTSASNSASAPLASEASTTNIAKSSHALGIGSIEPVALSSNTKLSTTATQPSASASVIASAKQVASARSKNIESDSAKSVKSVNASASSASPSAGLQSKIAYLRSDISEKEALEAGAATSAAFAAYVRANKKRNEVEVEYNYLSNSESKFKQVEIEITPSAKLMNDEVYRSGAVVQDLSENIEPTSATSPSSVGEANAVLAAVVRSQGKREH